MTQFLPDIDSHSNPLLNSILDRKPPQFSQDATELLASLRRQRVATGTPNVSDRTGSFLYHLLRDRGYAHVLELGTANGYSSIYLLEAISASKTGHLLTIEISREDFERAKANLHAYRERVTLVRSDATEFLRSAGDMQFDVIFIDALKTATLEHFLLARKLIRSNGAIIVDDVVKYANKMRDFYEYLDSHDIAYSIVMTDPDDGVMVIV